MKKLMVCVALVLGFGFLSAEKAEAGGRYCRPAPRYPVGPPRYSRDCGGFSVFSVRVSVERRGGSNSFGWGWSPAPVVYSQPAVVRVKPPVRVVDWDEESLLQLGEEKFQALSNEWDKDGKNFAVTIREQDFQTTKGVRVIEDVDYVATWTVTRKTKEGKEEVIQRREKFTIKFDDYGEFKKFKDD